MYYYMVDDFSIFSNMTNIYNNYQQDFIDLVMKSPCLLKILSIISQLHPEVYLSAGAVRNTVWSYLHGKTYDLNTSDMDVTYYNANEYDDSYQKELQSDLKSKFPNQDWDVVNQALVHRWYRKDNGETIQPLTSIEEALSLWSETATAVAIRFDSFGNLEIIAPFGLSDLFELNLRWNSALVSYQTFKNRVESKNWLQQWPKLKIVNS
ncbi:nucleotidyltransferase family protein [Acinetobacter pittii]|uniref:nucleotidyltransferase family protein n=1 Tax=Acinetobacter pittii TaxID=48296 RepID=UPI003260F812